MLYFPTSIVGLMGVKNGLFVELLLVLIEDNK